MSSSPAPFADLSDSPGLECVSFLLFFSSHYHGHSRGIHRKTMLKPFAFELPGKQESRADFPVQVKAFGKNSYEIQMSVNGKSARFCFFPGQVIHKQLEVNGQDTAKSMNNHEFCTDNVPR
jgi:hypothetical protein